MRVTADVSDFRRAGAILRTSPTMHRMKWRLAARIRLDAQPIVTEQKARVMAAGHHGTDRGWVSGVSIREAISSSLSVSTSLTAATAGVKIKSKTTPTIRNFRQAPRRFNQRSFRHPLFGQRGRGQWFSQVGAPGWFHEPALAGRDNFLRSCLLEINLTAREVAAEITAANRGHMP